MNQGTQKFLKGRWQKVYTNHANRVNSTDIETNAPSILAHIDACKLILSKDFDAYKEHCIANNLQWYPSWYE